MFKLIPALLLLFCTAFGLEARTVADFFKTAPDRVLPILPQNTRLDMIDYFQFGSSHASSNAFQGEARLNALSDAVAQFEADKDVELQMAVIPAKNDTVIALITTVNTPAPVSSIEFFDKNWNALSKAPFAMPKYAEWLNIKAADEVALLKLSLPFMPVSASFDPDATLLRLENTASKYLEKEEFEGIAPKIQEFKIYDLVQGRFVPRK